jgi:hypothetical protein
MSRRMGRNYGLGFFGISSMLLMLALLIMSTTKSLVTAQEPAKKTAEVATRLAQNLRPASSSSSANRAGSSSKRATMDSNNSLLMGEQRSNNLRLPRFFAKLVDEQQRESILAIQLEYQSRLNELERELERVRQDEVAAIEKVLTDSQRKLLSQRRAEAKAKSLQVASTDSDVTADQ